MEQADKTLQEMLAKRATMEREKDELVKYLVGEAGTKTETIFAVLSEFLTDFEVLPARHFGAHHRDGVKQNSKHTNEQRELQVLRDKRLQQFRGRGGRSSITGLIQDSCESSMMAAAIILMPIVLFLANSQDRGLVDHVLRSLRDGSGSTRTAATAPTS